MQSFSKNRAALFVFLASGILASRSTLAAEEAIFPKGTLAQRGYEKISFPSAAQKISHFKKTSNFDPSSETALPQNLHNQNINSKPSKTTSDSSVPSKVLENASDSRASSAMSNFNTANTQKINPPPAASLNWPITFEDSSHNLGNSMLQFQQYGPTAPYFHGGCDLRAAAQSEVRTPVSGRIEAGHYGYEVNDDGSMTKWWKAWPERGDLMYFEIAIISADGTRYEFHHVDRSTLPAEIKQLLDHGGGEIAAGTLVGRVISWPVSGPDGSYYHHIHYNIITSNGTRINPEYVSLPIEDKTAPTVHGLYAILKNNRVIQVTNGFRLNGSQVSEFVVATTDKREPNVYINPPPVVELKTGDGTLSGWNFRQALTNPDGKFPDIRKVFKAVLITPSGERLRTRGDYNHNFFLMRLEVPANAQPPFNIKVEDFAGAAQEFLIDN